MATDQKGKKPGKMKDLKSKKVSSAKAKNVKGGALSNSSMTLKSTSVLNPTLRNGFGGVIPCI